MPAYFDTGFVVREPAWHGLATVLDDNPDNAADALRLAELDWSVGKAPLFAEIPGSGSAHVPRRFATYRTDTNAVLGVVGEDWTPVQNVEAFAFMDELVQGGELRYATAGSLEGGAKVWLQVEMPEYFYVGGDKNEAIRRYILLCNGHAGTLSFRLKNVHERVVCANTLGIALSERANSFTARHTSGVGDRTREARDVLGLMFKQDESFALMSANLINTKMTSLDVVRFTEQLFVMPKDADKESRGYKNVVEARQQIRAILSTTPDLQNVKDTAWGALQAATEYADWHTRVQTQEGRFKRNILKDDPIKVRALGILAPDFAPRGAMRVGLKTPELV